MDDKFLYDHIKNAIKERKKLPNHSDQGSFAQSYCRRELLKKKLTPNSINTKMKSILKKFSNVDTYVDLSELIQSINIIRSKQISQKNICSPKRISMTNGYTKDSNDSGKDSEAFQFNMELIHSRIMAQLGDNFHKKYIKQNLQIDQLADDIEQHSNINSMALKNNSGNQISYLLGELKKIEEQDKYEDNLPWNSSFFHNLTKNLKRSKEQCQMQCFKNTSLNSKDSKQNNKLLHKISTYLQIALQNQHKQKWATKDMKNFRSTHGSFRFNRTKQTKFFTKNIKIEQDNSQLFKTQKKQTKLRHNLMKKINSQQRPHRQLKHSSYQTQTKSIFNKENSSLERTQTSSMSRKTDKPKAKINQNFTFRKRGVKRWVLNKLSNFIDDVDEQEINSKAQNKYYGDAINKLQKIIHNSYGNFKQQALAGPQQISQLKRYVNGVNSKMRKTTKCNGKYRM